MTLLDTRLMQVNGMYDLRLSLCMIVRDSSRTLPAALASVQPWVDEMVVVDTGSKDNTPEIARESGARVFHFPWCDDFAAARNESLRHARGQWLFWMDSDDTIDAENGRKLRELANRPIEQSPLAYVMQVHCPGPPVDGQMDYTVVDHVKMFRNLPELRFGGRIHEQILPAIRRLNGEIGWTDIFVVHSGSDHSPKGRCRKQQRDLHLLELELQDHPDHPFALFNLGMTYGDMNRHQQAVDVLKRCLQISKPAESHIRKAYALLVCSLTQLERLDDAWQWCQTGLNLFHNDPELQFRSGLIAHRKGNLDEAASAYNSALANRDERHFSSIDRGITGYKARQNLALVYSEQGRHDLAELQWRHVIEEVPVYRPGWHGLGEALLKQQRFMTAKVELEKMPVVPSLGSEATLWRHESAKARGEMSIAKRELEQAVESFPEDVELLRARGRFLFEHGEDSEAEQALLDLCRRQPSDGTTHHNLGTLYLRSGRFVDAKAAYERSLAVRPNYLPSVQLLADAVAHIH